MNTLKRAVEQGYLLHGSPHLTKCLEPRRARDEVKSSGNQIAVFATTNVAIAVWKAVAHQLRPDSLIGWSWNDGGTKILYAEDTELGNGYVYILSKDSFAAAADDAADYFSLTPVRPTQTIAVTPQELYKLQQEIGFQLDLH